MLSFEALQERSDRAWKRAGLRRITPHELRHTAITWLDDAGVRHKVISQLSGHELPHGGAQVTGRYTHVLPGDFERARDLFDAYLTRQIAESTG
jgi:integrase